MTDAPDFKPLGGYETVKYLGGYIGPDGVPVIATQFPPARGNYIGGRSVFVGWTCRWIKGASPDVTEVFAESFRDANGELDLNQSGVKWDHIRTRHVLWPGQWVVWTGHEFRVIPDEEFKRDYADVMLDYPTDPTKEA